jgi:hypothetical protein
MSVRQAVPLTHSRRPQAVADMPMAVSLSVRPPKVRLARRFGVGLFG